MPWIIAICVLVFVVIPSCAGVGIVVLANKQSDDLLKASDDFFSATDTLFPPTTVGSPASSTTTASDDPTRASSSFDDPFPIGSQVTPAKGWSIKVNSADLNADGAMSAASATNTPEPGKHFVIVNVTIGNGNDSAGLYPLHLSTALATKSGREVDNEDCTAIPPSPLDAGTEIGAGETMTGNICFEGTADEIVGSALVAGATFSDEAQDGRQYLALS